MKCTFVLTSLAMRKSVLSSRHQHVKKNGKGELNRARKEVDLFRDADKDCKLEYVDVLSCTFLLVKTDK